MITTGNKVTGIYVLKGRKEFKSGRHNLSFMDNSIKDSLDITMKVMPSLTTGLHYLKHVDKVLTVMDTFYFF